MWKRIANYWNEWAETYNELFKGEVIYFTSFYGGVVYIPEEEDDRPNTVQSEDK